MILSFLYSSWQFLPSQARHEWARSVRSEKTKKDELAIVELRLFLLISRFLK